MRKSHLINIILIVMIVCSSCKSIDQESYSNNDEKDVDIKVMTDVTLGESDLSMMGKDNYIIALRLYDGKYYEDYNPGPEYGANWVGNCKLCIIDTDKNYIIDSYSSNEFNEQLSVKNKFDITIEDYNNDGNYEFLVGQYGSSNFNIYNMYYITSDFKIGYYDEVGEINITNKEYSPVLDLDENGNIIYDYYDNNKGEKIIKTIDTELINHDDKQ
ncbi:hypothetical protein SH1V18_40710 [Vallitalea longa]|uniref:Uncharacterized protein n=1 Tax=Vallitalea longa TaxID=2936439 RepID=A0A9W6DFT8_9FIRM|nr:hypothetical protein [Vallitalea longa]GKX31591.1 hypothetical protein SH1V18_40710 [Vallitalea longa]